MADYSVTISGIAGRVSITEPGLFRGAKLLVDQAPAERIRGGRYRLKKLDGSTTEAQTQLSFGQYLPILIVEGVRYEVGPKLSKPLLVLSFLPFCLVFLGGALGGLCGGIGWGFNNQLARTSMPTTVKVVAMLIVAVASVFAYVGMATLFHLAIGR